MKITEAVLNKNFDAHVCQDIVVVANKYQSEILICKGIQKANVKSIMGVISLMLKKGDNILISAKGDDSEQATKGMLEFGFFDVK
ncbi:MAG: HPr family phosphocarrier protein [Bacillota bacterium]